MIRWLGVVLELSCSHFVTVPADHFNEDGEYLDRIGCPECGRASGPFVLSWRRA